MNHIIKKALVFAFMTVFLAATTGGSCFKTLPYTCYSGGSGCNGSGPGGASCAGCVCASPDQLGGPLCWYEDSIATVNRSTGGFYGAGSNKTTCYQDSYCTYTHTTWDCFGNSTKTIINVPTQTSYACGSSC